MKKWQIGLVAGVGVVILGFFGLITYILFGVTVKETRDISYYQALSGETAGEAALPILFDSYVNCPYDLPTLGELEPYEDCRFHHMAKRYSIFRSDSYILIVGFGAEEYTAQKAALEEKYTFCTAQSEGFSDGTMPGYQYTMDGFTLRAVEGGRYPSEILLIGYSDARQEIAVVYFYDQDLDYIDDPLGKFVENETGWNKVMK